MQRIDGDPDYPVTVRVGYYPNKDGGYNLSIKETTWAKAVHGDGTEEFKRVTSTYATTVPFGGATVDNADYAVLAQNMHSWVIPGVTGGIAQLESIEKLQHGLVNILS